MYIADLTLIYYNDREDFGGNTIQFEVQDNIDFESGFYSAVEEYLQTTDGKNAVEEVKGNFGAGDAVDYIPNDIWSKHGLKIIPNVAKKHLVLLNDIKLPTLEEN